MTIFQAIILGIIQGLTEFLPISSSAHLVIAPYLFGWTFPKDQIFVFDVLVQMGTLLAVIIYFWKDLVNIIVGFFKGITSKNPFKAPEARTGWLIILASIPGGLAGVLIKPLVEETFSNPVAVGALLFGTAILLLAAELIGKRERKFESITWLDALLIGLGQAVAIFPGISRSGSTISVGLMRGLRRTDAARFSFLMSIPIMLAAGLYSMLDLVKVAGLAAFLPVILTGVAVAAIVGYLSIKWLLNFLNSRSLSIFAAYCAVLGALVLVVAYFR
jgi:undecaprenyl-diphosphatase